MNVNTENKMVIADIHLELQVSRVVVQLHPAQVDQARQA
jgi:metallophosphoesterase superfamily enzyme